MKSNPKISIITPCYNSEQYIEDCIRSVFNQSYDNIEHIIVDGLSTDNTLEIIKKYEGLYNMKWVSEKDNGMYEAIAKGFAMASGDIYSWLNSDDMYLPWTCEIVSQVMCHYGVKWITGIPCHYNENGVLHNISRITPVFPATFIRKGYMDGRIASFLEQESMFWNKELWERYGKTIVEYKTAGDYHLWKKFAQSEKLYTIDSVISGFRIHSGQKSSDMEKYYEEAGELSSFGRILASSKIIQLCCLFRSLTTKTLRIKTRALLTGRE